MEYFVESMNPSWLDKFYFNSTNQKQIRMTHIMYDCFTKYPQNLLLSLSHTKLFGKPLQPSTYSCLWFLVWQSQVKQLS